MSPIEIEHDISNYFDKLVMMVMDNSQFRKERTATNKPGH